MTNAREERIRWRPHEIWEGDGRPAGRHDEHWRQAMQEVDGDPEAAQMDSMRGSTSDPAQSAPAKGRKRAAAGGMAGDAAPKARASRGASKASSGPREVTSEGTKPDGAPPSRRRSKSTEGADTASGAANSGGGRRKAAGSGEGASAKGGTRRTAKAPSAG